MNKIPKNYRYRIASQNRDNSLVVYDCLQKLELYIPAQWLAQYQACIHDFSPRDALILGHLLCERSSERETVHKNQQDCEFDIGNERKVNSGYSG